MYDLVLVILLNRLGIASVLAGAVNIMYLIGLVVVFFKVKGMDALEKKQLKEYKTRLALVENNNNADSTFADLNHVNEVFVDQIKMTPLETGQKLSVSTKPQLALTEESLSKRKDLHPPREDRDETGEVDYKSTDSGMLTYVATADWTALRRNQMSFAKGDVIEYVKGEGKWLRGILRQSSEYPLTGASLYYPIKYVKKEEKPSDELEMVTCQPNSEQENDNVLKPRSPAEEKSDNEGETDDEEEGAAGPLSPTCPRASDSNTGADPSVQRPRIQLVEAKRTWTSKKTNQLSFEEGDIIRVVNSTGNWHKGALFLSDLHPLTNKVLYYPSNLVTEVAVEHMAELLEARKDRDRALKEETSFNR